jgi:hypothetical protein
MEPNLRVWESIKTPATFERAVGEFRKQLVDSKVKEDNKPLIAHQLSKLPAGYADALYVGLLYSPYRPTFGVKDDAPSDIPPLASISSPKVEEPNSVRGGARHLMFPYGSMRPQPLSFF